MHHLLSKNQQLANMLQSKITQTRLSLDFGAQDDGMLQTDTASVFIDPEIERQLQAHGFHFTEFTGCEDSPDTGSLTSELHHASPQSTFLFGQVEEQQDSADYGPAAKTSTSTQGQPRVQLSHPDWDSPGGGIGAMDFSNFSDSNQMFQGMDYQFNSTAGGQSLFFDNTNGGT